MSTETKSVFVSAVDLSRSKVLPFSASELDVFGLKRQFLEAFDIPESCSDLFYVSYNGGSLESIDQIQDGQCLRLLLRVPGGKGGFGSMLRAIGAQIEKTTNREACRDLSGRRLRDINEEARLKKWISKQNEREVEKEIRRRAKLERRMAAPKHEFVDPEYDKLRSKIPDIVNDAVAHGLTVSKTAKRSAETVRNTPKKPKLWLGMDEEQLSNDSDETDEDSSSSGSEDSGSCTLQSSSNDGQIAGPSTVICVPTEICNSPATLQSQLDKTDSDAANLERRFEDKVDLGVKCDDSNTIQKATECSSKMHQDESCIENQPQKSTEREVQSHDPLNLEEFETIEDLEQLGLDRLKSALMALGLKCGGTLRQRAERLFCVKGLEVHQFDPSLLAKPCNKKAKK